TEVIEAPIAGLISSGPDRPEPLKVHLPAKEGVGLVTGHRIPGALGKNGLPVNIEVLEAIENGLPADQAVRTVMDDNPNVDAGLIAVDINGNIGVQNSEKVGSRTDIASAYLENGDAKVAVFNNEIHPIKITSKLAAAIAMEIMSEEQKPDMQITLNSGLKVELGDEDKVVIDKNNTAIEIFTTDPTILNGETVGVVPYLGSSIIKDGEKIGILMNEPLAVLNDGVIVEFAGRKTIIRDVKKV
ncbi:MAG TPA: hypothetical protein GX526_06640, partial [Thermoanaerobacterales bacterium]|nr:hypothetical protein [Thermoanaerobacterales bacterium]